MSKFKFEIRLFCWMCNLALKWSPVLSIDGTHNRFKHICWAMNQPTANVTNILLLRVMTVTKLGVLVL
jgi:hypothetical protein